jgi:uncharacterized protein with HEPN domain
MTRRDQQRLADILAALEAIDAHLARGELSDGLVFDAVRIRLVEIGEAVKSIGSEILAHEPGIPWPQIAAMRDRLAHRYFDTSHAVVAGTVAHDLAELRRATLRLHQRSLLGLATASPRSTLAVPGQSTAHRSGHPHDGMQYSVGVIGGTVVGRSNRRLPFEPTGIALQYRDALGAAVATLTASPGQVLHATYASASTDRVDIENVLTYNLGLARLRGATPHGIVLERERAAPADASSAQHEVRYCLVDESTAWAHWRAGQALAVVELAGANVLHNLPAPARWLATLRSRPTDLVRQTDVPEAVLVDVAVACPVTRRVSVTQLMKTLVDGVLAALHRYDGPHVVELAARSTAIAADLGAEELRALLEAEVERPLGRYAFLFPRGTGVQISPADDRIVGLRVRRRESAVEGIRVEVHDAAACVRAS